MIIIYNTKVEGHFQTLELLICIYIYIYTSLVSPLWLVLYPHLLVKI